MSAAATPTGRQRAAGRVPAAADWTPGSDGLRLGLSRCARGQASGSRGENVAVGVVDVRAGGAARLLSRGAPTCWQRSMRSGVTWPAPDVARPRNMLGWMRTRRSDAVGVSALAVTLALVDAVACGAGTMRPLSGRPITPQVLRPVRYVAGPGPGIPQVWLAASDGVRPRWLRGMKSHCSRAAAPTAARSVRDCSPRGDTGARDPLAVLGPKHRIATQPDAPVVPASSLCRWSMAGCG